MKNNWFNDVFLPSLFERTEPLKSLWLTAKQSRICVQNLDWHCTKDSTGAHEWYTGEWNGRTVEFNYSKKNSCGNIIFGRNQAEQEVAGKAAEEENKQFENELFASRINAIKSGNQRIINGTIRDYKKYSDLIADMQADIENGLYSETEPRYLETKKKLAFFTAIMCETGLAESQDAEQAEDTAEQEQTTAENAKPGKPKLHKIRNVDLAVCSAEQKVAYNLTFAHYNSNPAHKFTPEEFAEWCIKLYHPDSKTAEKYSREAIKKAIENGYMNYLNNPFIASDYEKIGKAFPVEPVPEYETTPDGNEIRIERIYTRNAEEFAENIAPFDNSDILEETADYVKVRDTFEDIYIFRSAWYKSKTPEQETECPGQMEIPGDDEYITEIDWAHLIGADKAETVKGECTMMKPKKKISVKARKPVPHGLYTVPECRKEDLKPVAMTKLQHDDGRVDTIATTQNGDSVCIMTAQTLDISGGIETPEAPAQAVENPVETVETTAETTTETAEIKRFCKGTAYSANGLKFDCTGTKPGFIRIMIDGEIKPRIMSVFVKDSAEYITYQHKTVTAFDIYADDTPTDSPEPAKPETIPSQSGTPSETPQTAETGKAEEAELIELPETKTIKIFYNGMKINGDKKITVKCSYDMDADGQTVRIYADGYGAQIPRDVFDNVKNDSDIMTDYFDKDGCTVTPEHPLFKYIQYAAAKCELRGYKANRKEKYEKFIAVNPGQPTAADLSAVAKYNADRAAAAKAAAEEKERAEQAEHEGQISELCVFSDSMVKMTCEKYPIRENTPTVRIEWSEHPAFSDGFRMSITAAQVLFSIFDEKQATDRQKENHSGAWYYKTKFVIEFTDPETCEQSTYTGRQDFGDGEGGILEHMLNHAEWERTHHHDGLHRYGAPVENPPETTDKLDFIKWLSGFLESSPETETERPEITMQTNTDSTADTATGAQAQNKITVTFAPELKQAAEKNSENYAECKQIMNDIDTAVSALPPEDIAHILDTLPHDTLGVLMARRICQQYAKTAPANAAMLLGAWILDFTNNDGAAQ